LSEREFRLVTLPGYEEHVEDCDPLDAVLVDPDAVAEQKEARAELREGSDARAARLGELLAALNEAQRAAAQQRLAHLSLQVPCVGVGGGL